MATVRAQQAAQRIDDEMTASQEALGGLSYLNYLAISQESYHATHGRYWQGLPLVAELDSEGELQTDPTACPTDQVESWADVLPGVPTSLASQPRIDTLRTRGRPDTYELWVKFLDDGSHWQKCFTGPSAGEWHALKEVD